MQIEPSWLLVCFKGEKPPIEKRAFWLHRTLTDWLNDHPGRNVAGTAAVMRRGILMGMNVWLEDDMLEGMAEETSSAEPQKREEPPAEEPKPGERKVPVTVDASLAESIHKEHLEALLQHAYEIFFKDQGKSPRLAVVSRGGLAVVFDRASEKGHVMRLERLGIDKEAEEEFRQWQASAKSNYFVMPLAPAKRGKKKDSE
jgi:hypothetical protein